MHLDGLTPSQGPQGPDRPAGTRKAEPKQGGKSFGAALEKAQAQQGQAKPADAPAASNAEPSPEQSFGSHIDAIRFKLQSGYYDSPKVNDALGDKLSGYFDDVA